MLDFLKFKPGVGAYRLTLVGEEWERPRYRARVENQFREFKTLMFRRGIGPASIAKRFGYDFNFDYGFLPENESVCVLSIVTPLPLDLDRMVTDGFVDFFEGNVKAEKFTDKGWVELELPVVAPEKSLLSQSCDSCGKPLGEVCYPVVGSLIYCSGCELIPELCVCKNEEPQTCFCGLPAALEGSVLICDSCGKPVLDCGCTKLKEE